MRTSQEWSQTEAYIFQWSSVTCSLPRKGASARQLWQQGCPAQARKPWDRQSNLSHQASSGGLRQRVAVRAVPETQAAGDVREGSAEDALLDALPPPAQPFAVILGAGPTGAFMVSTAAAVTTGIPLIP